MNLLLDTHTLLWWLAGAVELPKKARELVSDPGNLVFVSAASVWEIRIKQALGKVTVPPSFKEALAAEAFERLPIRIEHAHAVHELPPLHKDPFDRMLVAQAVCEELNLLTHDRQLQRYSELVIAV